MKIGKRMDYSLYSLLKEPIRFLVIDLVKNSVSEPVRNSMWNTLRDLEVHSASIRANYKKI
jgi:hypothetical protein